MRSLNPLGAPPAAIAAFGVDPGSDPQNVAKQLNSALDALIAANAALANASEGGKSAAVKGLVARGRRVNALFNAIQN